MRPRQRHTELTRPGSAARPVRRRAITGLGGLLTLALAASGCGLAGSRADGHAPLSGGIATYALPPNTLVNYIFPLTSTSYISVVNADNLSYLMYRPLYWFGDSKGRPLPNYRLSLAEPPVYNHQTVTIRLKGYKWSDGEFVTARDIVFWIHLMQTVDKSPNPGIHWGGYVPGYFPDNIVSIRTHSSDVIQLVIRGKFSRTWFTENELSQITAIPSHAWDATASGASDCTDVVGECMAVYNYLDSQSRDAATWAQSRLWKVVDGPWQLVSRDSQGVLTFAFNKSYSGPVAKRHISEFREVPFTSEEAEYNVLQAGGSNPLDVGYLPTVDAPVPPPGATVGQNPLAGYHLQALYPWALTYFPYNFSSLDPQAPIFRQQYFRQAFQDLVNQEAIIQGPLHGYGRLATSVIGSYPRTPYLSLKASQGDPFPYTPGEARKLLADNGWQVEPGGVSTCRRTGTAPGDCGPSIHEGAPLQFTLDYATGSAWLDAAMLQLKSNASLVGIDIKLYPMPFDSVVGIIGGDCGRSGHQPCPWQLANWGLGWTYSPDYLPTGEELFQSNAIANIGAYQDPADDRLIAGTLQSDSLRAIWTWEDKLTQKLPVVLQPDAPYELLENIDSLHIGVQDTTLAITPEFWYFLK